VGVHTRVYASLYTVCRQSRAVHAQQCHPVCVPGSVCTPSRVAESAALTGGLKGLGLSSRKGKKGSKEAKTSQNRGETPYNPLCSEPFFRLWQKQPPKVLSRLFTPWWVYPVIPCFTVVLGRFLTLIPVISRLFRVIPDQKVLLPGAIPGVSERRWETRRFTLLIRE